MLRNIGAVIAGMVVGMALNMALIQLNSLVLFPMPPGTDMNNPEQLNAYIASLPLTAFIVVVLAHLGQQLPLHLARGGMLSILIYAAV
jgi:hypothetical protein